MTSLEIKHQFVESLRKRLSAKEFTLLVECLDPKLGYRVCTQVDSKELSERARAILSPERMARREQEQKEFLERVKLHEELEGSWCDPFIERLPPPRREDLDVDDVTDLVKYIYAGLSNAIADLQFQLAELAGTGKLNPQANHDLLQFGWCLRTWEFLQDHTTARVRRAHHTCDCDWDRFDNTYSNGLQVMTRVDIEPHETADDHWQFNEHLCGDGPIQEYPRVGVYHISEPPFYRERKRSLDALPEPDWDDDEEDR